MNMIIDRNDVMKLLACLPLTLFSGGLINSHFEYLEQLVNGFLASIYFYLVDNIKSYAL